MTKCPKCGGEHLAPIHYGYPAFNEETKRRVEQKELFLGGGSEDQQAAEKQQKDKSVTHIYFS